MASLNTQLDNLIKQQRPIVQRVFKLAIRDVTSRVTLNRVVLALRRGDIDAAIDTLGLSRAALSGLITPLGATYAQAGQLAAASTVWITPVGRVKFRFDLANPTASRFITEYSSNLVTRISEDTRDAVRAVVRAGYDQGRGPLDIARDVIGRVGANGRRTGGVIGLNGHQANAVANMRSRLSSGDPVEMSKVFKMTRRDARFDRKIQKAIDGVTPLSRSDIDKITGRYADRLLELRGQTIARTETAHAVEAARYDAFKMGMDEANVPDWAVEKTWKHGGGRGDPREAHLGFSGQSVVGLNTPFTLPDGTQLMYPHDTSLGAGAKHVVNCTCRANMKVRWDLIAQRERSSSGVVGAFA